MTEDRIKNIQAKEEILNKLEAILNNAEEVLQKWNEVQPDFKELIDYYYSEQWRKDHEASNRGEIPMGIPHGVLTEDAIYDTLSRQRDLAIDYLKTITTILEQ